MPKESEKTMDQYILDVAKKNNPKTVNELVKLVHSKHAVPEKDILEHILNLQNQGKIALQRHQPPVTPLLRSYVFSSNAAGTGQSSL